MTNLETFLIFYSFIGLLVFVGTWNFGSESILQKVPKNSVMFTKVFGIFHHFVFFSLIFGFLLPKEYLAYHLLSLLFGFLHWQTNNQNCILTEIQQKLLNNKSYTFFKDSIFQNTISEEQSFYFSYLTFFISFFISLFRFIN